VDPTEAATLATTYESRAKGIDTGVIVSPLQLQLATGTQLLANFTADQLATFKGFTNVVTGWLDAQQCAGKLTADRMDKYSTAYHAVARAIKPSTPAPAPTKPGTSKPAAAVDTSPCANGHCPAPTQYQYRGRRR
jgi:hypothetical protein